MTRLLQFSTLIGFFSVSVLSSINGQTSTTKIANPFEYFKKLVSRIPEVEIQKWQEPDHKSIQNQLLRDIKSQYNIHGFQFIKPVPKKSYKQTLNVTLAFQLREIAKVIEKTQSVTLRGVLALLWHDEYLTWDPAKYKDLATIQLSDLDLWIPPVLATDETDMARMTPDGYSYGRTIYVNFQGDCMYLRPVVIKIRCPAMDFGNFPRDTHFCAFGFKLDHIPDKNAPSVRLGFAGKFHYLTKDSAGDPELEFHDHFILPNYHHNLSVEWKLVHFWKDESHWTDKLELEHENGRAKHLFSLLFYNIQFQRKAPYYGLVYVLPILISTVFLILTFMIPLGDKQRYWMALGGFISLCLIYNRLYEQLPPASNTVPRIVRFYGFTLIMCLLTLIETTILYRALLRLQIKHILPPPHWIRSIASCFGRFLCYTNPARIRIQGRNRDFEMNDSSDVILEMQSEDLNPIINSEWQDIVRIIDSLIFVFFLFAYIIGIFALLF